MKNIWQARDLGRFQKILEIYFNIVKNILIHSRDLGSNDQPWGRKGKDWTRLRFWRLSDLIHISIPVMDLFKIINKFVKKIPTVFVQHTKCICRFFF